MAAIPTFPEIELAPAIAVPAHGHLEFRTASGPGRLVRSIHDLPAHLLDQHFADDSKDLRYYELTRRTLATQFEQRFLLLHNTATGETVVQPVFFAKQDILDGLPRHLHSLLSCPRRLFPGWMRLRMLVVGCSAGEGALGSTAPWALQALDEALTVVAHRHATSLILLKDFPSGYRGAMRAFVQRGFQLLPSMPACTLDLDFSSFEEFVRTRLGSTFRETLRRKLRKAARHAKIEMEVVTDISTRAAEVHALYLQTFERSKLRFERLTADFFREIGREMPDRARFFLWRVDGKLVAFSLCLVHDGTLHHLNVGFDYSVAFDLHLYQVTLRDLIGWAVANDLKRYCTGQLNYEPKLRFRMRLAPLDLYVRHTSPLLDPLFKRALDFLQPVRHDPVLRQFPNASEL